MSQKKTTASKTAKTTKSSPAKKKSTKCRNPNGTFASGNGFAEKYKDEYADQLLEFFKVGISRVEYKREYDKDGQVKSEYPVEFTNDFPTMGMFARSIGCSVSALKAWAGITEDGKYKHDRFAFAYACAKEWAADMMESGALSGKLDSNMAKFVLSNDYGKTEKQVIETNITGIDEKDLALIRRVEQRLKGEGSGGDS